ncbi:MAG: hypothetical protein QW594_03985 [Candidatus Woesearchaeota archaeon]
MEKLNGKTAILYLLMLTIALAALPIFGFATTFASQQQTVSTSAMRAAESIDSKMTLFDPTVVKVDKEEYEPGEKVVVSWDIPQQYHNARQVIKAVYVTNTIENEVVLLRSNELLGKGRAEVYLPQWAAAGSVWKIKVSYEPEAKPAHVDTKLPIEWVSRPFKIRSSPVLAVCVDSDGGINYAKKGTITFHTYDKELFGGVDTCVGSTKLQEFYCEPIQSQVIYTQESAETATSQTLLYHLKMIEYDCPFGCSDGACKSSGIAANQPPVIKRIDGPDVLAVDDIGTWYVLAYDPEGSELTYTIDWGQKEQRNMFINTPEEFKNKPIFYFSYAKPGEYWINIKVTDAQGLSAQSQVKVLVRPKTPGPNPTVDMPNTYWTNWKDRDDPTGTGDWETLKDFPDVCQKPLAIECKTVDGELDAFAAGQEIICSTDIGFVCYNPWNTKEPCKDYKVRFLCGQAPEQQPTCADHKGGNDLFTKAITTGIAAWGAKTHKETFADVCTAEEFSTTVMKGFCNKDGYLDKKYVKCPEGTYCSAGYCQPLFQAKIKEAVTCQFAMPTMNYEGATQRPQPSAKPMPMDNECRGSTNPNKDSYEFYCKGEQECTVTLQEKPGTVIYWRSNLGGNAKTVVDGVDEKIFFSGNSQGQILSEGVKCVFEGSTKPQTCYSSVLNGTQYLNYECTGTDACVNWVKGYEGTTIVWKSSCGGYAYTTIDGQNKYAYFSCSEHEKKQLLRAVDDGESVFPQPEERIKLQLGVEQKPTKEQCTDGCPFEGRCISYGIRIINGQASYCDLSGNFAEQKADGQKCQNNYECISNSCVSGICKNVLEDIEENTGLLRKILKWLGIA